MNKALVIFVSVHFLTACQSKKDIPSEILAPKKMQAVLWDLMRADQFLYTYVFSKDTSVNKKNESVKLYQEIFAIHKINKKEFQKSFSYYQSHPGLLQVIMDSLQKKSAESFSGITPLAEDTITKSTKEEKLQIQDSIAPPVIPRKRIRKVIGN